jgi:uncharacterized membrane protein YeaQ/YmgE (transglycosylase-associated protein family)
MTAIPPPSAAYPEKSQATTALVLSIFGVLCCGILGVVGAIMANTEKQAMAAGRRDASNQGMAQAAFIIGIVGAALWILGIIFNAAVLPGLIEDVPFG